MKTQTKKILVFLAYVSIAIIVVTVMRLIITSSEVETNQKETEVRDPHPTTSDINFLEEKRKRVPAGGFDSFSIFQIICIDGYKWVYVIGPKGSIEFKQMLKDSKDYKLVPVPCKEE